MSARLDRLVAWLCLVLFLGTGAVPSRGVVVCVEADGCVRLELKTPDAGCVACDEHERGDAAAGASFARDEGGACPCFDLALPGGGDEQRTAPRSVDAGVCAALTPVSAMPQALARAVAPTRGPPACVPRVARGLVELASVVLRV